MPLKHIAGDVTDPIKFVDNVVAHVVNDAGKYGAGVSGAIAKRWPEAEKYYRAQHKYANHKVKLGEVLWSAPDPHLLVAQMVAMRGVRSFGKPKPIRYEALEECLVKVAKAARVLPAPDDRASFEHVAIHMPRIGAGLAGGDWDHIEPLIEEVFWDLKVFIYTPKEEQ